MDMQNIKKKILKIIDDVFYKKPHIEEATSNLLNFIVKTKREKSLKEKIQMKPPKEFKKISKLGKRLKE
jgi:hypothetical protein